MMTAESILSKRPVLGLVMFDHNQINYVVTINATWPSREGIKLQLNPQLDTSIHKKSDFNSCGGFSVQ